MKVLNMRTLYSMILVVSISLSCISCHRNRLKTNEKNLSEEIIILEKQNTETARAAHEKELAVTLNRPKKGMLFKEDRSVDPAHPPVVIDLAGNLNNTKEIKLSDVASEIKYIRLEKVPDTSFSRVMKFKYYLFSDYIVATNPGGILLYSKDGKFLSLIVKNITTGIKVDPDWMTVPGTNTFIGGGTSVWNNGDSLYYAYRNSISGQEYIMKYSLSKTQVGQLKKYEPENPDQIMGLGEIAINMNPSGNKPVWKFKLAPEQVMWGMSSDYLYQTVGTFLLNKNTYAKEIARTDKIAVVSNKGDTLTTFTGFEDNTLRYESEGKKYLWNGLNDTVFQIIDYNRILPIHVLNLGQYKVSPEQVRQIGSDLTGKIIPRHWAENSNYVFLVFAKDAYDSPDSRKHKKVKLYHALYSKQSQQLFIIKGDPLNYSPDILENNIDGGMSVWPLSYMIGNNGEVLISLKGKELKDRIRSEPFRLSKAPALKKKELEKLASTVGENEDILMIIR